MGSRPERGGRLEGADQALAPLVVALERVFAEDGLALRVVELEVPSPAVTRPSLSLTVSRNMGSWLMSRMAWTGDCRL